MKKINRYFFGLVILLMVVLFAIAPSIRSAAKRN